MKRKLTANDLMDLGACAPELRKFKRVWPKGVYITVENFVKAEKLGFDTGWLMSKALHGRKWEKHDRRTDKLWDKWFHTSEMTVAEYTRLVNEECVRALKEDWSPEPKK